MPKETVLTIDTLEPGQRIRIYFNENNINNATYEFRGKVDDILVLINKGSSHFLRDESYIHYLIQKGHATILPPDTLKLDDQV